MNITVKCPNCNAQVAHTNAFCTFCGVSLHSPAPAPKPFVPAYEEPVAAPAAADAFTGPRFCPLGHDVPDPAPGYCQDCGSPLVYEKPVPASSYEAPAVKPSVKRTCPKGHTFTDASLRYCPVCALPFDEDPSVVAGSVWPCGHLNTPSTLFCTTCGVRKGFKPRRDPAPAPASSASPASSGYGSIPFGLRPPTDDDLMRK